MNVRIGELPRYHVAYMRHVGPYGAHGIPALWKRLHEWTRTRGLDTPDYDRPCLEVYGGNPEVAGRPGAFRCELCIPVRPR